MLTVDREAKAEPADLPGDDRGTKDSVPGPRSSALGPRPSVAAQTGSRTRAILFPVLTGGTAEGIPQQAGPFTMRWTGPFARCACSCAGGGVFTRHPRYDRAPFFAPENAANAPMARNRKVIASAVSLQPSVSRSKCSVNSEVAETSSSSAPITAMPMSWPR